MLSGDYRPGDHASLLKQDTQREGEHSEKSRYQACADWDIHLTAAWQSESRQGADPPCESGTGRPEGRPGRRGPVPIGFRQIGAARDSDGDGDRGVRAAALRHGAVLLVAWHVTACPRRHCAGMLWARGRRRPGQWEPLDRDPTEESTD